MQQTKKQTSMLEVSSSETSVNIYLHCATSQKKAVFNNTWKFTSTPTCLHGRHRQRDEFILLFPFRGQTLMSVFLYEIIMTFTSECSVEKGFWMYHYPLRNSWSVKYLNSFRTDNVWCSNWSRVFEISVRWNRLRKSPNYNSIFPPKLPVMSLCK
jgi:hypothetical protein